MKMRKILGLLVLPAMAVLAYGQAQAYMGIQIPANEGLLDAVVKAQGRNGPVFNCEKIVSIEKSNSSDGKFPAWQYTCQGEVLKAYKDASGINHSVGEKGNFQFKIIAMRIKGLSKPSKDFSGIIALQGPSAKTALQSVTLDRAGMLPTVTVEGKNYAVPTKAKLLSSPEDLKAMAASPNMKALGTTNNDLSAAIDKLTSPGKKLKLSSKALQRIDSAMVAEGEEQDSGEVEVYENFDTNSVATVIKALGVKYYEEK